MSFAGLANPVTWEVSRETVGERKLIAPDDATGELADALTWVNNMVCVQTVYPNTFIPCQASTQELGVIAKLLALADVSEALVEAEATEERDTVPDQIRERLNELYDSFVSQYGLLRDYRSYAERPFEDYRLQIYVFELELNGMKADIFTERMNRPPRRFEMRFEEEDLTERVRNACMALLAWAGHLNLDVLAQATSLPREFVTEQVVTQGFAYRVPEFAPEHIESEEDEPVDAEGWTEKDRDRATKLLAMTASPNEHEADTALSILRRLAKQDNTTPEALGYIPVNRGKQCAWIGNDKKEVDAEWLGETCKAFIYKEKRKRSWCVIHTHTGYAIKTRIQERGVAIKILRDLRHPDLKTIWDAKTSQEFNACEEKPFLANLLRRYEWI